MNLGKNFAFPLPFCVSLFTYFVVAFLIIIIIIIFSLALAVLDKPHVKGTLGSSVTSLGKSENESPKESLLPSLCYLIAELWLFSSSIYLYSLGPAIDACAGNKGIIGDSSW